MQKGEADEKETSRGMVGTCCKYKREIEDKGCLVAPLPPPLSHSSQPTDKGSAWSLPYPPPPFAPSFLHVYIIHRLQRGISLLVSNLEVVSIITDIGQWWWSFVCSPLFNRASVSRDIDCFGLTETSEISGGRQRFWMRQVFSIRQRFWMRQVFSIRQRFWMHQIFSIRQRFWVRQCFCIRRVFQGAPMFCIYFAAPIFLYIFLHSYLVCDNNLTDANVLRLV